MRKLFNRLKPFFGNGPYYLLSKDQDIFNELCKYVDSALLAKIKLSKKFRFDLENKGAEVSILLNDAIEYSIDEEEIERITQNLLIVINEPEYKTEYFHYSPVLTDSINSCFKGEDGIEDIKIYGTSLFKERYTSLFNEN